MNRESQRLFDFYPLEDRILLSGEGFDGADVAPDADLTAALMAEFADVEGQSSEEAERSRSSNDRSGRNDR